MRNETLKADFTKQYADLSHVFSHLSDSDTALIKQAMYTMYLHGTMYACVEAELLEHPYLTL